DEASARIPAIFLRPSLKLRPARLPPLNATTSFGHLISTGSAVAVRMPSAAATPPASVIHGATDRRRTIVDTYSPAPGGENHTRRRRPRPDVCAPATNVVPSASPRSAAAAARSFVEPVSVK